MKLPSKALSRIRALRERPTRYLADLSIRNKAIGIILIASVSILGLAMSLVIIRDLRALREDMIETTRVMASAFGDNIKIALLFDDNENLNWLPDTLKRLPQIDAVVVLDAAGEEFFSYPAHEEPGRIPEGILAKFDEQEFRSYEDGGHLHFVDPLYEPSEVEVELDPTPLESVDSAVVPAAPEEPTARLGTSYIRVHNRLSTEKTQEYLTGSLGLLLALLAASVFFAVLLEKVLSRPILDLADTARRITELHDYSIRVEKTSNDEIGILSDGFNDMLNQIEERQEELERSNRDLDQFAYVASHDLKAPLRAISTLSEWIEEDLGDANDETQEQLKLLRGRVRRMERLIDGILAYSRVGRKDADIEEVNVARLLNEVVELVAPPPGFQVRIGDNMPTLVTKRVMLQQVFSNLLSNAVKYHDRPDGNIEIGVKTLPDRYEFSVADDGPGIAPDYHDKVFLIFHTLQPRDDYESTGIGLAVVKKILEDQGGRIYLESAEGKGTTFSFTWPKTVKVQEAENRFARSRVISAVDPIEQTG